MWLICDPVGTAAARHAMPFGAQSKYCDRAFTFVPFTVSVPPLAHHAKLTPKTHTQAQMQEAAHSEAMAQRNSIHDASALQKSTKIGLLCESDVFLICFLDGTKFEEGHNSLTHVLVAVNLLTITFRYQCAIIYLPPRVRVHHQQLRAADKEGSSQQQMSDGTGSFCPDRPVVHGPPLQRRESALLRRHEQ